MTIRVSPKTNPFFGNMDQPNQHIHSSTRVKKVKVILKIHMWQIDCTILSFSVCETPTLVRLRKLPSEKCLGCDCFKFCVFRFFSRVELINQFSSPTSCQFTSRRSTASIIFLAAVFVGFIFVSDISCWFFHSNFFLTIMMTEFTNSKLPTLPVQEGLS